MNSRDLINQWSNMTLDEIDEQLASLKEHDAVATLYGHEEAAELEEDARSVAKAFGGPPVILLPGIMGSNLNSVSGIAQQLWIDFDTLIKGRASYLELDENGTGDSVSIVEIVATGVEPVTYTPLSLDLNRVGTVYAFPYDWRRSILSLAEQLDRRIERWAVHENEKFTLIGHSMGGLVARAYVQLFPGKAEQRVRRIISLGTPYFGSVEAIVNLTSGSRRMKIAERLNDVNDMRKLVRTLPGVYQLLPTADAPGRAQAPANWDWLNSADYQIPEVRQTYLDQVTELFDLLHTNTPPVPTVQIIGCNLKTTMAVTRKPNGSFDEPTITHEGDGTVPLWSAFLAEADNYYIQEDHGWLPTNRRVRAAIVDLVEGRTPNLPTTIPQRRTGIGRLLDAPRLAAMRIRTANATGRITMRELSELYFAL